MKGTLKLLDRAGSGAFGYIKSDDGRQIFVHVREVVDGAELRRGMRLEFDCEPDPRGRDLIATNVTECGRPAQLDGLRRGFVRKFDTARGFGFLRPAAGGRSLFFHINKSPDLDIPIVGGVEVQFEVSIDARSGRTEAVNVRRIAPEHSGNEGKVTQWQPEQSQDGKERLDSSP